MKQYQLLFTGLLILTSCQDSLLQQEFIEPPMKSDTTEGMQRVVVSSRSELKEMIGRMNDSGLPLSRAVPGVNLSENEELFVSLVEANRQKVMASLTPEQLDSIKNDEDGLEYCPEDSIIADIHFAQMLNADREIQVGDTIFKYFADGVAYTLACHESELKELKDEIIKRHLHLNPDLGPGIPMKIAPHVSFKPLYFTTTRIVDIDMDGGSSPNYTAQDYNDIANIPASAIRDISFKRGDKMAGDGNWWHRTWSGFFGYNITAINKFTNDKKLTLNLYNQNYIIYSNIGTKLKMQKRRCGIWWNTRADKMLLGWETVVVEYTHYEKMMAPPAPELANHTVTTKDPSPVFFEDDVLIQIPYTSYDFTSQDVVGTYKAAVTNAYNNASSWAKQHAGSAENCGLLATHEKKSWIVHGPSSMTTTNKGSIEHKFYTRWFPYNWEFDFSLEGTVKLQTIRITPNETADIAAGSVYGAIQYKGQWLAGRITMKP